MKTPIFSSQQVCMVICIIVDSWWPVDALNISGYDGILAIEFISVYFAFSALRLLVGTQEGHRTTLV